MKPTDEKLQRLLKAAAKAGPAVVAPPLGLETRVLAHWRAAMAEDETISLFAFLRRAAVGAGVVLALCAAWSLTQPHTTATGDEAALFDFDLQPSLVQ
jgi:hypothetical protein